MNKKFISGIITGVVIGIGVGSTFPMLSATDLKINKSKSRSNTKYNKSSVPVSSANSMREVEGLLRELNKTLKNQSDKVIAQNDKMIDKLDKISKQNSF